MNENTLREMPMNELVALKELVSKVYDDRKGVITAGHDGKFEYQGVRFTPQTTADLDTLSKADRKMYETARVHKETANGKMLAIAKKADRKINAWRAALI